MTLVLAFALADGSRFLAADRRLSKKADCSEFEDRERSKFYDVGSGFYFTSYGSFSGNVGGFMVGASVASGPVKTSAVAGMLATYHSRQRGGEQLGYLLAGPDGAVFHVVPHRGEQLWLNENGEPGIWCGGFFGNNPTALPGWPGGRTAAQQAASLRNEAAAVTFATELVEAASQGTPCVSPSADWLAVPQRE